MRRFARTALWYAASALAVAAPAAPAFAQTPNPFRQERWSEDWREAHGPDAPFGAAFKDMPVASGVTLSFGGDARWRSEVLDAPRLGITGERRDASVLQRLLLHGDLHVGEHFRLFAQLGAYQAIGKQVINPTDVDHFDLSQAFADLSGDLGDVHATVRVGRQELALGSQRYVTLRDSSNLRQRHDIVRVMLSEGAWRADLFGGRPTQDRPGVFDDRADPTQRFYGLRIGRTFGEVSADILYYDLDRDGFHLAGLVEDDHRRTIGGHVIGRVGAYDFDAEFLHQSGDFGALDVSAFGGAVEIGRTFADQRYHPRYGARFTYGSGDSDPLDGTQGTFSPPFPRATWFGQTGLGSFSNSIEAAATVGLAPTSNFNVDFKLGALWRADTNDFVYSGAATTLPGTRGGKAYMGVSPSLLMVWRPTENVSLTAYASTTSVSQTMHDFGASDVSYAQVSIALRF